MAYDPLSLYSDPNQGLTLSNNTFTQLGMASNEIFQGIGDEYKAKGAGLEAAQYEEASKFATLEAEVQHNTTIVNAAQSQRQAYQGVGATAAGAAGAGFSGAGSAGDILRSSAQQGSLQVAATTQTGEVQELGYEEQAKSYESMAEAALVAEKADKSAGIGSYITAGVSALGAAYSSGALGYAAMALMVL